jgi:CDP-diacylglycerol--glycerol-3-phosphate 3-phosphatidyltransferase
VIHSWIPSPLDEVAGVFHIKAYIIDDQLVLSGANLSEEYFQDRQDRYLLFDQGKRMLIEGPV